MGWETPEALKDYEKIANKLSRSPTEADLNKRRSLENRGTMKLYRKTKLSPSNGGFYETLTRTDNRSLREETRTGYETYRG